MTSNYLGQLKNRLEAGFAEAIRVFMPEAISVVRSAKPVPVAADGNVLDMGKRYRLTSGHAPLFSLFTFFKNSQ